MIHSHNTEGVVRKQQSYQMYLHYLHFSKPAGPQFFDSECSFYLKFNS